MPHERNSVLSENLESVFSHALQNSAPKSPRWNQRAFRCIDEVHIRSMRFGYARVSTDGQSVEAQVRQLTKAGCKKVLRETASGAKTDRSQLRKALDQLEAGDVLMVTRLDRLARSTRDLLNTLATISGN
jgi:predicted site-specific integrase-resolvase